jgi:hypothetical protein
LIALPSAIARLCRSTQTTRQRDHLLVHGKGTARHIILSESDLDAFIERVTRRPLAPAHGIQIRQRRFTPRSKRVRTRGAFARLGGYRGEKIGFDRQASSRGKGRQVSAAVQGPSAGA